VGAGKVPKSACISLGPWGESHDAAVTPSLQRAQNLGYLQADMVVHGCGQRKEHTRKEGGWVCGRAVSHARRKPHPSQG
jgi:hypothetical protein